ncbi:hypothetical protein OAG68_02550 [bacterium]|nr:hypothetical protein [bacterium]
MKGKIRFSLKSLFAFSLCAALFAWLVSSQLDKRKLLIVGCELCSDKGIEIEFYCGQGRVIDYYTWLENGRKGFPKFLRAEKDVFFDSEVLAFVRDYKTISHAYIKGGKWSRRDVDRLCGISHLFGVELIDASIEPDVLEYMKKNESFLKQVLSRKETDSKGATPPPERQQNTAAERGSSRTGPPIV